jgi:hypothetical protein
VELKTFVTETLVSIVTGIQNAQMTLSQTGAIVNPGPRIESFHSSDVTYDENPNVETVEFDVALTVVEGAQVNSGINAGILSVLGSKIESQSGASESAISRVKFRVPIVFPKQK